LDLQSASQAQLEQWEQSLSHDYATIQAQKLNLDLTRGKPLNQLLFVRFPDMTVITVYVSMWA